MLSFCIWSFSCEVQTVQDTSNGRMDKAVFCLLLLASTCSSSAEVNSEEFLTTTTATTPVETTPLTKPTQPIIVDSTSDSLSDIYPHRTEFFTTTTSTATPGEDSKLDSAGVPGKDDELDSIAVPGKDGEPESTVAPGYDGEHVSIAAPRDDGELSSTVAPGDDDEYVSAATSREDGELDSTSAPQNDEYLQDDKDLASSSKRVCEGELSHTDLQSFEEAMNAFSKDLLKQVELKSPSPNVVVSPFSIALGLLQLALGAKKPTKQLILKTLHVESLQCLHEKFQKVIKRLVESSLNVAIRMYVQKEYPIENDFLERSERIYGTKAVNLKANMTQNVEAINTWVRDVTRGKIPEFLSNIPADVVLLLLNAVHFKGTWINRFNPAKTVSDVFTVSAEETVKVDMMQSAKYPLSFFTHEKLDSHVARLRFKGNMSFVIVMPININWNLSRILDNFNRTEIYSRFHKVKSTILKVPKLDLDFKLELSNVLSNLGLGQLFSNPNLKGISEKTMFVSSVEHQSTLQLNEDGVEAAAATSVVLARSLSTFSVNCPFLYYVFDDITGLPIFQGYVRNPKPGFQTQRTKTSHIRDFKLKPPTKGSVPK